MSGSQSPAVEIAPNMIVEVTVGAEAIVAAAEAARVAAEEAAQRAENAAASSGGGGIFVRTWAGRSGDVEPTLEDFEELQDALDEKADLAALTTLQTTVAGKADSSALAGKADVSTVTALQTTVAGKADTSALTTGLAGKADASTVAALAADVDAVEAALAGKADTSAVTSGLATKADASVVTALQTTVAGKADTSALTTGLAGKQDVSQKGQPNGYAGLGSDGKVPTAQLPTLVGGSGGIPYYSSAAALIAADPGNYSSVGVVQLLGYAGAGTRGGGLFRWDGSSTLPADGGYVLRPDGISSSSPGRLVRILENNVLRPQHYNAAGDFNRGSFDADAKGGETMNWGTASDDSPYISALIVAAQQYALDVDLGPFGYLLAGTTLPLITRPITIFGSSEAMSTLAAHPEEYRGAVLFLHDLFGLDTRPVKYGGAVLRDFTVLGRRQYLNDTTWVPAATQHGIIYADRHDRVELRGMTVEGFRGWGICFCLPLTTDTPYMREWHLNTIRVRDCGYSTLCAGMEFFGWPTAESSNEQRSYGVDVVFSRGCNVRFRKKEGPKPFQHYDFLGGMSHGVSAVIENRFEDGIDYAKEDVFVLDGQFLNMNFEGWSFNASFNGQYSIGVRNSNVIDVTVPTGQTFPLETLAVGDRRLQVTLPALPIYAIPNGSMTTQEGSPFLYINWPDHGLQRRQWVTFDRLAATFPFARTINSRSFNGITPRVEGWVEDVIDEDNIIVFAGRGLATVTGSVDLSAVPANERTIKATYGIVQAPSDTTTYSTISFDIMDAEVRWRALDPDNPTVELSVGGTPIANVYPIRYLAGDFNTIQFLVPIGQVPTSVATKNLPAGYVVRVGAGENGPVFCHWKGNGTSGLDGIRVTHGSNLGFEVPIATTGTDLRVTKTIQGPIHYVASAAEGGAGYFLNIDREVRHLVGPHHQGTSPVAPPASPRRVLGTDAYNNADEFSLRRTITSAAQSSVTTDGKAARTDGMNLVQVTRPGDFSIEVRVEAGALPTSTRNKAGWVFLVEGYWDGGAAAPVIERLNGDTTLVPLCTGGGGIPPSTVSPTATNADLFRAYFHPVYNAASGNAGFDLRVAGQASTRISASAAVRLLRVGGFR